ncbi:hypothetical protein B9Z55_021363 [Caenorhabditis nigoni]|uniref:Uncharacterized protein n=1 Tax=Caenorhabditis nigoni TaxID=1611254 RepID=A0A2G5TRM8_9PELO|nr:hypothetical protein B9Z55_021363 [Caenorhabditis nigoni]
MASWILQWIGFADCAIIDSSNQTSPNPQYEYEKWKPGGFGGSFAGKNAKNRIANRIRNFDGSDKAVMESFLRSGRTWPYALAFFCFFAVIVFLVVLCCCKLRGQGGGGGNRRRPGGEDNGGDDDDNDSDNGDSPGESSRLNKWWPKSFKKQNQLLRKSGFKNQLNLVKQKMHSAVEEVTEPSEGRQSGSTGGAVSAFNHIQFNSIDESAPSTSSQDTPAMNTRSRRRKSG